MCVTFPGQSDKLTHSLSSLNNIFSYFFILEAFIKLTVYGREYFASYWNILDFIVILETITSLTVETFGLNYTFDSAVLRIIRVGRMLKFLKNAKMLNKVFSSFLICLPKMLLYFLVFFIIMFVYCIIGMNLFYNIISKDGDEDLWSFNSFIDGIGILLLTASGGNWQRYMRHFGSSRQEDFYCNYTDELTIEERSKSFLLCGNSFSKIYFISFMLISRLLFVTLVKALICASFFVNSCFRK